MRDIGSANVQGTLYDLLSPRVVGDYIENIGAACQNPDGYAANKIFVAYDSSMNQHLYKTTAQITQGTQITSSNCEQTSLSELLSGSGSSSSLEDLSDTDISSKTAGDIVEYNNSTGKWENTQKLVNLEKSIAPVEDGATLSQAYAIGEKFIRGGVRYKAKTDLASGTQFSSLIINTNYEAADDVSSEIQTLTNNLEDEVETRAKLGAHNLLPSTAVTQTINGVTFTVNPDKSVTLSTDSGGATANAVFPLCYNIKFKSGMIFKGCPSSGGVSKYYMAIENTSPPYTRYALDSGEGSEISESSDGNNFTYIRVISGQILTTPITFYPTICLASDPSTDYAQYAKTNRELTEDTNAIEPMLNVLGAKNLLKNTASSATVNGVTFTVNSDGSVTVNGTATALSTINVATNFVTTEKVIMSGCPKGGGESNYQLDTVGITPQVADRGEGAIIASGQTITAIRIRIASGYTANNLVFYPMIRPASIEDDTYVPYAMTNRELTDEVNIKDISSAFYSSLSENVSAVDCAVYKRGKHIFGTVVLNKTNYFVNNDAVLTLSYKPIKTINSFGALSTDRYGGADFNIGSVFINSGNGVITIVPRAENKSYIKFSLDYATND